MKSLASSLWFFLLLLLPMASASELVLSVDSSATNGRQIASNVPQYGNVWSSQSQSFEAPKPHILFGFKFYDIGSSDAGRTLVYNLYEGENEYTTLVGTREVAMPDAFGERVFVLADFSEYTLVEGASYTMEIAILAEDTPLEGEAIDLHVGTNLENVYADGRFYFRTGYDNSFFVDNDLHFQIWDADAVAVGDAAVWGAIREELDKPEGDLVKADFEALTTLTVVSDAAVDLGGLEYAVNLSSLSVESESVSGFEALWDLEALDFVTLTAPDRDGEAFSQWSDGSTANPRVLWTTGSEDLAFVAQYENTSGNPWQNGFVFTMEGEVSAVIDLPSSIDVEVGDTYRLRTRYLVDGQSQSSSDGLLAILYAADTVGLETEVEIGEYVWTLRSSSSLVHTRFLSMGRRGSGEESHDSLEWYLSAFNRGGSEYDFPGSNGDFHAINVEFQDTEMSGALFGAEPFIPTGTEQVGWESVDMGRSFIEGSNGEGNWRIELESLPSALASYSIERIPGYLVLSEDELEADFGAEDLELAIESDKDWTATSGSDWITVSAASGSGDGVLTISVEANPEYAQRSGVVSIGGVGVAIYQEALPTPFAHLPFSKTTVSAGASTLELAIDSNKKWRALESSSWIELVDGGVGEGDGSLELLVSANESVEMRVAYVYLEGQRLEIVQNGVGFGGVEDSCLFLGNAAASGLEVDFYDIGDWTASSSESWIVLSEDSGSGEGTIGFDLMENDTGVSRTGTITVGEYVYTIVQGAKEGYLFGMGRNSYGQARGDGTASSFDVPVESLSDVQDVQVGWSFSLFLKTDGTLWGYGSGIFPKGSDVAVTDDLVLIDEDVVSVSGAYNGFVYIKEGGDLYESVKVPPSMVASNVFRADMGYNGYFFINGESELWGKSLIPGQSAFGRFGLGSDYDPEDLSFIADDVVDADLGWWSSAYVTADGELWVAGAQWSGLVGNDGWQNVVDHKVLATDVLEVEVGANNMLIKKFDGHLYGVGTNNIYNVEGGAGVSYEPVLIAEGVDTFGMGSEFSPHPFYRSLSGKSYAWGVNPYGLLATGRRLDFLPEPTEQTREFRVSASNSTYALYLDDDNTVWAAGLAISGLWGVDVPEAEDLDAKVLNVGNVRSIETNFNSTYFVDEDDRLWVIGVDGVQGAEVLALEPKMVAEDIDRVNAAYGVLMLKMDGSLWMVGRTGNPSNEELYEPELVAEGVVDFANAFSAIYYIDGNGDLYGVGRNYNFELGNEDPDFEATEGVLIDTDVVSVSAGLDHVIYLKSDGVAWALGDNNFGELGNSLDTNENYYQPQMVASNVVEVQASVGGSAYLDSNGNLYGTGENRNYILSGTEGNVLNWTWVASGVEHFELSQNRLTFIYDSGDLFYRGAGPVDNVVESYPRHLAAGVSAVSDSGSHLVYKQENPITGLLGTYEVEFDEKELDLSAEVWGPWSGISKSEWIRFADGSGDGTKSTISLEFDVNLTGEERVGQVMVGGTSVEIVQAGGDYEQGFLGADEFVFLSSDDEDEFSLEYYQSGDWDISTEAEWINLSIDSGDYLGALSFTLDVNETGEVRIGEIRLGDSVFTVIQRAEDGDLDSYRRLYSQGDNTWGQVSANGSISSFATPIELFGGVKDAALSGDAFVLMENGDLWARSMYRGYWDFQLEAVVYDDYALIDSGVEKIYDVDTTNYGLLYSKNMNELWALMDSSEGPEFIAENVIDAEIQNGGIMAITEEGDLYGESFGGSWGVGRWGTGSESELTERTLLDEDVIDIAMGWWFTSYVKADGTLWISGPEWGGVHGGALEYKQIAEGVVQIDAGTKQLVYKTSDGELYAFGANESPLFGAETDGQVLESAVLVASAVDTFIVTGDYSSSLYYTLETGEAYIVGFNTSGQLGTGEWVDEQYEPALLERSYQSVSIFGFWNLMVDDEGGLWFAGSASQFSLPIDSSDYDSGVNVRSILNEEPKQILAGSGYVLRVMEDDTLWGVGSNLHGQLIEGGDVYYAEWTQLDSDVEKVACYADVGVLVLYKDGVLKALGDFGQRQSDDGALASLFGDEGDSIVASGVADMAVGYESIFYIDVDGDLYGLGGNSNRQLGSADTDLVASDAMLLDSGVLALSAGAHFVIYTKGEGDLYVQGLDPRDGIAREVPALLDTSVESVSCSWDSVLYTKSDGTLWGLGSNTSNMFGPGSGRIVEPSMVADDVVDFSLRQGSLSFVNSLGELYAAGDLRVFDFGQQTSDTPVLIALDVLDVELSGYNSSWASTYYVGRGDLVVDRYVLEAGPGVTELTLDVESIGPWAAFTSADWIGIASNLNPASLKELALTLDPNHEGEERIGEILLDGMYIEVIQQPWEVQPLAPPSLVRVSGVGGKWKVGVSESSDVNLYDWIHIVDTQVEGEYFLTFDQNESGSVRYADIVVDGQRYWVGQNEKKLGRNLYSLGMNKNGQLGNGTKSYHDEPVLIADSVAKAVQGKGFTLFVDDEKNLSFIGRLPNTIENEFSPFAKTVVSSDVEKLVSVNDYLDAFAYITEEGTLYWNSGAYYQYPGYEDGIAEGEVGYEIDTGVQSVSMSSVHALYVKDNGSLWAFGQTYYKSFGEVENDTGIGVGPIMIADGILAAAAGQSHSVFIRDDNTLWGLGSIWTGALGVPDFGNGIYMVEAERLEEAVSARLVAAGINATAWVELDGSVKAMGSGVLGASSGVAVTVEKDFDGADIAQIFFSYSGTLHLRLANGDVYAVNEDKLAELVVSEVLSYSPGQEHTLTVDADGKLWGVGQDYWGQAGWTFEESGMGIELVADGVDSAKAGNLASWVVDVDGTLLVSGLVQPDPNEPALIDSAEFVPFQENVAKVYPNVFTSTVMWIGTSGHLWAMGDNWGGEFGDGTEEGYYSEPKIVASDIVEVAHGSGYALFLDKAGYVYGSGRNYGGQIGQSPEGVNGTNTRMVITNDAKAIAAGTGHSLVLKTDGILLGFGQTYGGVLGLDPDAVGSYRWEPMVLDTDVEAIAAGSSLTVYVKSDGTLWGLGYAPRLGVEGEGEGFRKLQTLEPVLLDTDVVDIECGASGYVYRKMDGSIWGVGGNTSGELGISDFSSVDEPTKLFEDVSSVSIGNQFTLLLADSTVGDLASETDFVGYKGSIEFELFGDWEARSDSDWIRLTSDVEGTGSGVVTYTVDPNLSEFDRVGFIEINGIKYRIDQSGLEGAPYAFFEIEELEVGTEASVQSVNVLSNTFWTALTDATWLHLKAPVGGIGNGKVRFSVDENEGILPRVGTIRLGARTLTVTQEGSLGGIYFGDEEPSTSSARTSEDVALSDFAGLWISDDGTEGDLIGYCTEGDQVSAFAYALTALDADTLEVDLGDDETTLLVKNEYGSFEGTLPCIGEISFSKILPVEGESESEYTGFYESEPEEGSDDRLIILVAPSGESIAIQSGSSGAVAARGRIASDGSIVVADADSAAPKKIRVSRDEGSSKLVLKRTTLGRSRAKTDSEEESIAVEVASIGNWTVTEDASWITPDLSAGSGSQTLTLVIAENDTSVLRTATVKIGSETYRVRQYGKLVDGMGFDAWLRAYFTEAEVTALGSGAADEDSDFDLLTNGEEWDLGLDPTEFSDRLRRKIEVVGSRVLVSVWPVSDAGMVELESTANFVDWQLVTPAAKSLVEGVLTFEMELGSELNFRVKVGAEE